MGRIRQFGAALAAALIGLLTAGDSVAWTFIPPPQAFTGCLIYPDAVSPPLRNATLVEFAGDIQAIGPDNEVTIPKDAIVVPCEGAAVLPGFWNSHVHFTEPHWVDAADAWREWDKKGQIRQHMADTFLRYGFVDVVDTGSDLHNTQKLQRFTSWPYIRTTGAPFVPPNGTPFYVEGFKFPELANAVQARDAVNAALDEGANAIKLMTVSLTRGNPLPAMSLETVRAVTETAHARGKWVLAHPTNRKGVELAIEGGVDVLLHTAPIGGPWDEALVKRMVAANISLVPTLALWDYEAAKTGDDEMAKHFREVSAQQVAAFAKAGGRILFGTDVGYMTQYDPTPEYLAMQEAGLTFQQILASLTTAPAELFLRDWSLILDGEKELTREDLLASLPENPPLLFIEKSEFAKLTVGASATFVVVDGDPAEDIRRLARVLRTVINGLTVYTRRP